MQVISSQCSNSARESSRSRKKGLSLTSRSRCNSQEKQSLTEETLQTIVFNPAQTQTSIKLEHVQEKLSWLNFDSRQTYSNILASKTLAEMPKITFRYMNESAKHFDNGNIFSGQFSAIENPQINRGRPMKIQEPRKVVISHSVQTKNLSQSKINPQSFLNDANPSKQLIDSRRIDREIIQEKVIALLTPIEQQTVRSNAFSLQKSPQKLNIQVPNQPQSSQSLQKNNQNPKLIQQNLSPYLLLASSTKKYESKQLSPGVKEPGSLQIMSLEKIPQVQEFNINQNEEDVELSVEENSFSPKEQTIEEIFVEDNENKSIEQISIRISEPVSEHQSNTVELAQKVEETALKNKVINVVQATIDFDSKTKSNCLSPSKIQKQNQQNKILSEIENRAPQTQQTQTMSGRRNIKRMKEIEKRLQEIISICNHNL